MIRSLRQLLHPLLAAWKTVTLELRKLDGQIKEIVRDSPVHTNLMTIPGITAAAYVATVDSPGRFSNAKDVGAYLGLTPRRYQSGEVDRNGRVSKCGDAMLRAFSSRLRMHYLREHGINPHCGPGALRSQKEPDRQRRKWQLRES